MPDLNKMAKELVAAVTDNPYADQTNNMTAYTALKQVAEEVEKKYLAHEPQCEGEPCTCRAIQITPLEAHKLNREINKFQENKIRELEQARDESRERIEELEDWILEDSVIIPPRGSVQLRCKICGNDLHHWPADDSSHQPLCMRGKILISRAQIQNQRTTQ